MTLIIKSDTAYTGRTPVKNIMDFLTDKDSKKAFLQNLLVDTKKGASALDGVNIESIFNKLKKHKALVEASGGVIYSLSQTLKAMLLVQKQGLSDSQYIALSPSFGVRLTQEDKIAGAYTLSGDYIRLDIGDISVIKTTSGDFAFESNAPSRFERHDKLVAGSAMVLASNSSFRNSTAELNVILGRTSIFDKDALRFGILTQRIDSSSALGQVIRIGVNARMDGGYADTFEVDSISSQITLLRSGTEINSREFTSERFESNAVIQWLDFSDEGVITSEVWYVLADKQGVGAAISDHLSA